MELPSTVKRTTRGMRWMLLIASGLVFIVGIQLYILTGLTDRFFAWTIASPLTAAFLGGGYWASFAMEFLASRKRSWAHARIAVPAVLIFTTLTLIVTLLHLDKFHFFVPNLLTRGVTWVWLAVYAIVPVVMAVLLIGQLRAPGNDPPRQAPLPLWCHVLLLLHALIMAPLGVALLVAPTTIAPFWPWSLTPLTARAVGAWLLALGVAVAHASRENDWQRVQVATASYLVYGVLQLLALLRYPGAMRWQDPAAWFYVAFMISVAGMGAYGWRQSLRVLRIDTIPGSLPVA